MKYKKYIDVNFDELWKNKLNQVKQYIDLNKKSPSCSDKNVDIKQIGTWVINQKKNYDIDIEKCKEIMKNKQIYDVWTLFINDLKYKKFICIDLDEVWITKLNKVKQYIDINQKAPSSKDKDTDIKHIGQWISNQKTKYDIDIKNCKYIMKEEQIHLLWTEFINDLKYKQYICKV